MQVLLPRWRPEGGVWPPKWQVYGVLRGSHQPQCNHGFFTVKFPFTFSGRSCAEQQRRTWACCRSAAGSLWKAAAPAAGRCSGWRWGCCCWRRRRRKPNRWPPIRRTSATSTLVSTRKQSPVARGSRVFFPERCTGNPAIWVTDTSCFSCKAPKDPETVFECAYSAEHICMQTLSIYPCFGAVYDIHSPE